MFTLTSKLRVNNTTGVFVYILIYQQLLVCKQTSLREHITNILLANINQTKKSQQYLYLRSFSIYVICVRWQNAY